MSKYKELLERVQEYLQDDNNLELKDGNITLYELYGVLDKSIKELYKKKESKELLKEVNEENPIVRTIGKLFKKKEFLDKYKDVYLSYDEKEAYISFHKDFRSNDNFYICKDNDSDELYSKFGSLNDEQKEIIDKHYDEILDILTGLQEYRDITGIVESYSPNDKQKQQVNDGFMNAVITYDIYGRLNLHLGLSDDADPENVSRRNYYRQDRIQDIINENQDQIMKNIVVDEETLNPSCKRLLYRNRNEK